MCHNEQDHFRIPCPKSIIYCEAGQRQLFSSGVAYGLQIIWQGSQNKGRELKNAAHKLEIDENRHHIICIIHCILLYALQGIALRGHREQIDADNPTLNRGNVLAIVLLTSVYDDVVQMSRLCITKREIRPS